MKRLIIPFALTAAVAVIVSTGGAANVKPLAPDKASALVNSGASHNNAVVGQAESPQAAMAAASQSGAQVEVAPGMTPAQATGAASSSPNGAVAAETAAVAASPVCWHQDGMWEEWGTWPYQQRVTETRDWCGYLGGAQTYRVSSARGGTTLCSWGSQYTNFVSGGNGKTWTVVRSGASFACPTDIPWITIHTDRWQEWSCNTWGNCAWVRGS